MPNVYGIAGTQVLGLAGHSFRVRNYDGREIEFRIPKQGAGWPRGGLEAYGLLVDCLHPQYGAVPSFLKIFKQDFPERKARNAFLIQLGLARHHPWLFNGMPYVTYTGRINGTQVVAHAAKRIGMDRAESEDIARLRDSRQFNFPRDVRRRLVGHLCCAVGALERLQFIHSDLSPRNVIITTAPDAGPAAVLCDYDGFQHPSQKLIPPAARPLGSTGYQYPELLRRIAAQQPNLRVETDRFALGVLACEMMVWDQTTEEDLQRSELLTNDLVLTGDLTQIPAKIRSRWSDGFDLLHRSLTTDDPRNMPSPIEWLASVGVMLPPDLLPLTSSFTSTPRVSIRHRRGHPPQYVPIKDVRLTNKSGSFASVDRRFPQLAQIAFTRGQGTLELSFEGSSPVVITRAGHQLPALRAPCRVAVQPGDSIDSALIHLEIRQEPRTSSTPKQA